MSQGTLQVANQGFPGFRTDLNAALAALNSKNSGTTAPSALAAGQSWLDTSTGTRPLQKQYDGADWISVTEFDTNANEARPYVGTGAFGRHPTLPASGTSPDFGSPTRQWGTGHFVSLQVGTSGDALTQYDEGSFTPGINIATGTCSLSLQAGKYVRVGNVVTITGALQVGTISTSPAPSGALNITGLPFTIPNANGNFSTMAPQLQGWASSLARDVIGRFEVNDTKVRLQKHNGTTGYASEVGGDIAASAIIYFGGSYILS